MPRSSVVRKMRDVFKTGQEPLGSDSALYGFFIDALRDIYWAEKQLTKAIPKMEKAAHATKLKQAFATHLEETATHVERLEQVFKLLGETARGKKCEAIEGLVSEGKTIIEDTPDATPTRDCGLVCAARKVEHYEIASYDAMVRIAKAIGQDEVAKILEKTLKEEQNTDDLLTGLGDDVIEEALSQEQMQ